MKTKKRRTNILPGLYVVLDYGDDDAGTVFRDRDTGAILVFDKLSKARKYAAKNYGYSRYPEARKDGWCKVVPLVDAI